MIKYISKTNIQKTKPWLVLLFIALFVAVWFWIYNIYNYNNINQDNRFTIQSLEMNYCFDRYDYLDTDDISYYDWYNNSQLMQKNMQDLSTLIVYAENNNMSVACPEGKICDVNKDNLIDSEDLWFFEQLLRDIDQDDNKLIKFMKDNNLPIDCDIR